MFLPPSLDLPMMSIDPALLLEVPVHHIELGDAPVSRKKANLVPIVPVVAHHLLPSCILWTSELHLHLYHQYQLALLESH
jgi:hypothetical protein